MSELDLVPPPVGTDLLDRPSATAQAATDGDQPRGMRPRSHPLLRPTSLLALLVVLLVVLAAVAPGLFAHASPYDSDFAHKLQAPGGSHWFGTDQLGRDVFSRVVHGTSLTLRATLVAVAIAFGVGATLGLLAGYLRGLVDTVVMRFVDILLAIPSLLLALAVVTALGPGTIKVAVAVGVSSVATFARITRAEVLRVRSSDFVEAATVIGLRRSAVLARHVLPNAAGPAVALATLELGTAIIAVSSLSFLGFGAPLPQPEWGSLVAEGRDYLATAWWLAAMPCSVIVAVVLSANRISRAVGKTGRR